MRVASQSCSLGFCAGVLRASCDAKLLRKHCPRSYCLGHAASKSCFSSFCVRPSCKSCCAILFLQPVHRTVEQKLLCNMFLMLLRRPVEQKLLHKMCLKSCLEPSCIRCFAKFFVRLLHWTVLLRHCFAELAVSQGFAWGVVQNHTTAFSGMCIALSCKSCLQCGFSACA